MSASAIQTLEASAQVLMASPNLVTPDQRRQAESVFLEFRAMKNPYQLCRDILENSSSDYVLFEAAGLIKSGLIREWSLLSKEDILSIREYLLNYLLRKENPPFLREKLLQTIAIIIKRGSVDDAGRERKALLAELEKIILSSPIGQQKLACSLILAIMQEFAITVKSADVGLTWEVHFRLKKSFETLNLKRIFRFSIGVLEQICSSGQPPEGEHALLTKQLLTIVEKILCWSYVYPILSKRLIGALESIFESDTAPALRLGKNWEDTIMKPELIALFFEIHMYVHSNPDLVNSSLNCLVQLASLSGVVVATNDMKQMYLENYVNNFLRFLSLTSLNKREIFGVAEIYRRLVQFFTPALIAGTPPTFLQLLTSYTCQCIRELVNEELGAEETVLKETLEKFLHTWSSLVNDVDGYSNERLRNPCIDVFNTFIHSRLAPPDGIRGLNNVESNDEDIKDRIDDHERQQYNDVLMTIGAMGRKATAHCCDVLFNLLHERSERLENLFRHMLMTKTVASNTDLVILYDDLNWLLMITNHFLTVDSMGSEATIPLELLEQSIRENANIDISMRYLVGESTSPVNVDSVLKLIAVILRISEFECFILESDLGFVFSPYLSATISWFLTLWANCYLMLDPEEYTEISPVIEYAFKNDSNVAVWIVQRLAKRCGIVLKRYAAEPDAANEVLKLLVHLSNVCPNKNQLASCEEFVELVAWEATGSNLPGELRKGLHTVFARVACFTDGEAKERLVSGSAALQQKLMNLLNLQADTEPVRNMLADTLDCFLGISEGMVEFGVMDDQLTILYNSLEKIPEIIFKYHNYPGVVFPALNFLSKTAKKAMHSRVEHIMKFVDICNTTFEVYARRNSGKISSIPQDAEEEAYEDVIYLMELVRWLSYDDNGWSTCARGLRMLLPMVSPPLLAMPVLAKKAFLLLKDLEMTDKLATLPIEDFEAVIAALRIGLTAVSSEVLTVCCETIAGLATKAQTITNEDSRYATSLLAFAELLFMLVIKMDIPHDSIPAASAAIYCLMCIKPSLLEALARQIIVAFAADDTANVPRLEDAFRLLTNDVRFDGYRPHKIKFQDNFDKFLASVHGFLFIK